MRINETAENLQQVDSEDLRMPEVAEAVWKNLAAGCRDRLAAGEDVLPAVYEYVDRVSPMVVGGKGWNSAGQLGAFLDGHFGVDAGLGFLACSLSFVDEYEDILVIASQPGVRDEDWDWQLEKLYADYTGLLLGLKPEVYSEDDEAKPDESAETETKETEQP